MIDLDLSGKRALVTGASLGIGEAVVKLLADHGADVSFCARTESGVAALAGYKPNGAGTVTGFIADMEDATSTQTFLEAATAGGDIDILINNVGASPSRNFLYCLMRTGSRCMNSICFQRCGVLGTVCLQCESKSGAGSLWSPVARQNIRMPRSSTMARPKRR